MYVDDDWIFDDDTLFDDDGEGVRGGGADGPAQSRRGTGDGAGVHRGGRDGSGASAGTEEDVPATAEDAAEQLPELLDPEDRLSRLPPETLLKVMSHLELKDLVWAQRVSRRFKHLALDRSLYIRITRIALWGGTDLWGRGLADTNIGRVKVGTRGERETKVSRIRACLQFLLEQGTR